MSDEDGPGDDPDGTAGGSENEGKAPTVVQLSAFRGNAAKEPQTASTTAQLALAERKLEEQRFRHAEEAKDREAERGRDRWLFLSVLIWTGSVSLIGFGLALFPDNGATREFGRAIVFALLGAVAGAFGGYATGRSRR